MTNPATFVSDDIVEKATQAYLDFADESECGDDAKDLIRAALQAVWPDPSDAEKILAVCRRIVNAQAEDDALWSPQGIVEAYLAQELRTLHRAVEGNLEVGGGGGSMSSPESSDMEPVAIDVTPRANEHGAWVQIHPLSGPPFGMHPDQARELAGRLTGAAIEAERRATAIRDRR